MLHNYDFVYVFWCCASACEHHLNINSLNIPLLPNSFVTFFYDDEIYGAKMFACFMGNY